MDARSPHQADDPVIVTGCGHVVVEGAPCDPTPYLKAPKLRKYMGVQDDLAVTAAARAMQAARLQGHDPERIGLYLAVGYIPFEQGDLEPLLAASLEDGRVSMEKFSTAGFRAVNGLLTFRCLPNMPAFHISVNCNIQGPYFVTYPGPGQFYLALEEAVTALRAGTIDAALVAGVAHQRNFLVEYHFGRVDAPVPRERLRDAAGCLVLERADQSRPCIALLNELEIWYEATWVQAEADTPFRERFMGFEPTIAGYLGPASLPVRLSAALGKASITHTVACHDGLMCRSHWRAP